MSAEELELRIDKLSADIIQQKEVLKQLESSKSAAQRQLNAIRDPVARLPLEISSDILIQCLPVRPGPNTSDAPLLFLNICNAWTDITLSTPALWAAIHVDESVVDPANHLATWLARAGNRALSITLPTNLTGDIAAVVEEHTDRLQELTMYHDPDDIALVIGAWPFPFLHILTMVAVRGESRSTIDETMDLLRVFPNLIECTFDRVVYESQNPAQNPAAEVLVLPHMKHLKFGRYPYFYSSERILDYILTPHLQTLHFPAHHLKLTGLIRFLNRSSPPLQKIVLGSETLAAFDWSMDQMEKCLSLLPQLTQIEIIQPTHRAAADFVTILASSPHLVPYLSRISLQRINPSTPWYEKLVSALSVRRQHIDLVHAEWRYGNGGYPESPAKHVCVALRQLAAAGMQIHVGTEGHNYI